MKLLAICATALAVTLGSTAAHATLYTFSFSNVEGGTAGTVQGQIDLPNGDGTFAALSITVNSAPAALGYSLPLSVLTAMPNIVDNTFTVSGGNITSYDYGSQNSTEAFTLGYSTLGSLLSVKGSFSATTGVLDLNNSTVSFAAASVPVPAPPALAALLSGLVALGAVRRTSSPARKDRV